MDQTADSLNTTSIILVSPDFDADSAFQYVKMQVDFGPRIPGSEAHAKCAAWLASKLRGFGAKVMLQSTLLKTYDGRHYTLKNIIASYAPEKKERVLITAHWDTRPFSNEDPNEAMKNQPFDAANDGGSGVAVILEMAKQLQQKQPDIGIDSFYGIWKITEKATIKHLMKAPGALVHNTGQAIPMFPDIKRCTVSIWIWLAEIMRSFCVKGIPANMPLTF